MPRTERVATQRRNGRTIRGTCGDGVVKRLNVSLDRSALARIEIEHVERGGGFPSKCARAVALLHDVAHDRAAHFIRVADVFRDRTGNAARYARRNHRLGTG
jgi:hypothetical protein